MFSARGSGSLKRKQLASPHSVNPHEAWLNPCTEYVVKIIPMDGGSNSQPQRTCKEERNERCLEKHVRRKTRKSMENIIQAGTGERLGVEL